MTKASSVIVGIPKSEELWETVTTFSGDVYYITSKRDNREFYFLYQAEDGRAARLGKDRNPAALEQKYIITKGK